jgi:hypothetical protein
VEAATLLLANNIDVLAYPAHSRGDALPILPGGLADGYAR